MTVSNPSGEQPPQDDAALLTAALSHSWAWYDEYSSRAFQVINYYIVASAVAITAYTTAINGKDYGLAVALAIAALGLTAIACTAELYVLNVAALAVPALTEMQERIGGRLRTGSMRIAGLQGPSIRDPRFQIPGAEWPIRGEAWTARHERDGANQVDLACREHRRFAP